MMLSGLCQKEWKKRVENSIRVRMHHQLFQFPNSISHRFYLLYADSLKVLSLTRGKAPDQLLHRNQRLPMLVLVLLWVDKGDKKSCTIGNYDWNINDIWPEGLTEGGWLDYRTYSRISPHDFCHVMCRVRFNLFDLWHERISS